MKEPIRQSETAIKVRKTLFLICNQGKILYFLSGWEAETYDFHLSFLDRENERKKNWKIFFFLKNWHFYFLFVY